MAAAPRRTPSSIFTVVPVSTSFQILVIDQLNRAVVDDSTRPDFAARGMEPFRPFGDAGGTMQYYQLPDDVLEDPHALRAWADKSR